MFPRISRNSKRIIAILSQHRNPSQIAWGIAIGTMLGLIPKDNLVALSLLVMIGLFRINQLTACSTAVAVQIMSGILSSTTSSIGEQLLEQQFLTGSIVFLYQFPVLPWACLENAHVTGGLAIGLAVLLPVYAICVWTLAKARYRLEHIALEQVADNAVQYRKSVTEQSRLRKSMPLTGIKLHTENSLNPETVTPEMSKVLTPELIGNQRIQTADSRPASRVSSIPPQRKIQQTITPTIFRGESHWDGSDTILRETVIEVVRYRRPNSVEHPIQSNEMSPAASPIQGIPMPAGKVSTVNSQKSISEAFSPASIAANTSASISFDSGHVPGQTNHRDESLRYLLWHINGSRENVRKSSEKTA